MRVQDSNLNSVSITTGGSARADGVQPGRSGSSSAKAKDGQDELSLSDFGSRVHGISGNTAERTARVSQLAAAYKSGNYHPDAQAVAKGVVNDALQAR